MSNLELVDILTFAGLILLVFGIPIGIGYALWLILAPVGFWQIFATAVLWFVMSFIADLVCIPLYVVFFMWWLL